MENIQDLEKFLLMSKGCVDEMDYDGALKYAMLAVSCTDTPRADVCCCAGEIYMMKGKLRWASWWFEKAIGSVWVGINGETIDNMYSTWFPMLKLSYIYYKENRIDDSLDMTEAVLKIVPDNEDALANKEVLLSLKEDK